MASSLTDELRLARLGVLCAGAPDIGALEDDHQGQFGPGSDAADDAAQCDDETPDRFAWVTLLSRLWISAATENLWGLTAIFNTPVRNHPPRALLRAALEHTARAWWVLDGAGADERAARAWLARWAGIRDEAEIARKDKGRTGAMQSAPARLTDIETRIDEVFGEKPREAKRRFEHSLCGEKIGSNSRLVEQVARGTLGDDAPVSALYGVHSLLLHPSTTAVMAFAESDGKRITIPPGDVGHTVGSVLTILGIWRGALQRVLAFHGWEHPDLPEWSEALDAAIVAHNREYPSSGDGQGQSGDGASSGAVGGAATDAEQGATMAELDDVAQDVEVVLPDLDDVPGLADVAEDLANMSVLAVNIVEGTNEDAEPRWFGVVTLAASPALTMPWALGGRDSKTNAQGAVEELLRGLVAGRHDAQRLHPSDESRLPRDRWHEVFTAAVRRRWG